MDKTGLVTLIAGLVVCGLGGFAIWIFLPEVITAVKGLHRPPFHRDHARYLRRSDIPGLKDPFLKKTALEISFESNHNALGGFFSAARASPGCERAV